MPLLIAWSLVALWLGLLTPQARGAAAATATAPSPCGDPGSICAEFDAATAVFVANVVSLSVEPQEPDLRPVQLQTVIFDVTEAFKGTAAGPLSVDFNVADVRERRFSVGETVVVYLRGSARTRSVACTRTRRTTSDESEASTLRELVRGSAGGAIEGTLRVFEGTRPPALPAGTPLDHVDVTAEAVDRHETVRASSQTGGYFAFPWLEPGRYRIRLESETYAPVVRDVVIDPRQRCLTLAPVTVQLR